MNSSAVMYGNTYDVSLTDLNIVNTPCEHMYGKYLFIKWLYINLYINNGSIERTLTTTG